MPYGYRCVDCNYLHIFGVGLIMDTKLIPCGAYRHCPITLERQSVYALMITEAIDLKCRLDTFRFSIDFLNGHMVTKWIIPAKVDMPKANICEPGLLYLKMSRVNYTKLLEDNYQFGKRPSYRMKIDWIMDRRIYINGNIV